jgi:hypothetical protein
MTNLRSTLENAISDLDTAIERECLEDVGITVAYMREALAKPDEPEAKPGAVKCPTCKRPFEEVSIRELVERQAESPVVPPQRDLDPESKRVLYGNMRELMEKSEPKTKLTMEEARNTICTGCGLTLYACQCPSENRQAKLPEEGNYGTD